MKKYSILTLVAIFAILSSCGTSQKENITEKRPLSMQDIEGYWVEDEITVEHYHNGEVTDLKYGYKDSYRVKDSLLIFNDSDTIFVQSVTDNVIKFHYAKETEILRMERATSKDLLEGEWVGMFKDKPFVLKVKSRKRLNLILMGQDQKNVKYTFVGDDSFFIDDEDKTHFTFKFDDGYMGLTLRIPGVEEKLGEEINIVLTRNLD